MERDREREWLDEDRVRNFLFERLTRHAARPAEDLSKLATALRVASQQLEWSPGSRYVERAADGIQRVASFVKETDPDRMAQDLRSFALREPALFIGGALLAGFGGGRFLRSSARNGAAPGAPTTERTRREDRGQTQAWDEAERETDDEERSERKRAPAGAKRIGRAT